MRTGTSRNVSPFFRISLRALGAQFTWPPVHRRRRPQGTGRAAYIEALESRQLLSSVAILSNITKATNDNEAVAITSSDFNAAFSDPNPLNSVEILSSPFNGTLTLTVDSVTSSVSNDQIIPADELDGLLYTPDSNFTGSDSFQWTASDDGTNFADTPASVNVSILVPSVTDINFTLDVNAGHTFTSTDFTNVYSSNNPLAVVDIDSLPNNGTLTFNGATLNSMTTLPMSIPIADISELVYTPTTNFAGIDSFEWDASDGNVISNTADVNFTLNSDLADISKTSLSNVPVEFSPGDFNGVYTSGNPLQSITVTSLPTSGTLTFIENSSSTAVTANQVIAESDLGNLTYTPNSDFVGSDTFSFTATDGITTSNPGSVDLMVSSYYTAFTKNVDKNLPLNFSSSDFTGTFAVTLQSLKVVRVPTHGALFLTVSGTTTRVNEGQIIPVGELSGLTFRPGNNFVGDDSIAWEATDGTGYKTPIGTVSLVVAAPFATTFSENVGLNTPFAFEAADFSDQFAGDASLATVKILSLPAHGTLTLSGQPVTVNEIVPAASVSALTYTPRVNYAGADAFNWTASDGQTYAPGSTVDLSVASLTVTGGGLSITNGEKSPVTTNFTDFATDAESGPTFTRTYVVTNITNNTINFTGGVNLVQIVGAHSSEFTLTSPPVDSLGPGQTTSFTISFLPIATGVETATVELPYLTLGNATTNGASFNFNIQGTGVSAPVVETSAQLSATNSDSQVLMVASTKKGKGTGAVNGDILYITYTGRLLDGTVFDQSSNHGNIPLAFRLDDTSTESYITNSTANFDANTTVDFTVIPGWEAALQGIKPGETRTLIVDSDFGYGAGGTTGIPGGATLVFDVTCQAIDDAPSFGITDSSTGTEVIPGQKTPSTSNGTDFGTLPAGQTYIGQSFTGTNNNPTITNGTAGILSGPTILNASGQDAISFKITGADTKDFIAEGSFDSFTIFFRPTAPGVRTATIHFITDDPNHRDFSFVVRGESAPDVDLLFAAVGTKAFPATTQQDGDVKTTVPIVLENFGNSAVPSATPTTDITITAADTSNASAVPVVIGSITENLSGFRSLSTRVIDIPVDIPASLANADYVLDLAVNGTMAIAESDSTNNSATTSMDITGSLISTSLPANIVDSPAAVKGKVSVTIENSGEYTLPSNEGASVQIVAFNTNASTSTDLGAPTVVSLKSLLGTGASHTFTIPVNYPAGLVSGSYTLEAVITPTVRLLESSIENNTVTKTSAGGNLGVTTGPASVDLTTAFSAVSPGKVSVSGTLMHMDVPVTISNVGNISVPSATPTTDVDIFLANAGDTTSALIPVGTIAHANLKGLAEGKSVTVDVPVTVPTSMTGGAFIYEVQVNNSAAIPELNTVNNSATTSAGISGVLIVSSMPGTVSSLTATHGTVFVRVENAGGLTLPSNQQVKVEILLENTSTSATTVISAGFKAESDKTWATPSGNDTFGFKVTVPAGMAPGLYDIEAQLEFSPGLIQSTAPDTLLKLNTGGVAIVLSIA